MNESLCIRTIKINDYVRGERLPHFPDGHYVLFAGRVALLTDSKAAIDASKIIAYVRHSEDDFNVAVITTDPDLIYTVTDASEIAMLTKEEFEKFLFAILRHGNRLTMELKENGVLTYVGKPRAREAFEREWVPSARRPSDHMGAECTTEPPAPLSRAGRLPSYPGMELPTPTEPPPIPKPPLVPGDAVYKRSPSRPSLFSDLLRENAAQTLDENDFQLIEFELDDPFKNERPVSTRSIPPPLPARATLPTIPPQGPTSLSPMVAVVDIEEVARDPFPSNVEGSGDVMFVREDELVVAREVNLTAAGPMEDPQDDFEFPPLDESRGTQDDTPTIPPAAMQDPPTSEEPRTAA